ncbi:Protein of unknown function [Bacillus cereus]|nr:Protein of unknown function [Bacillus cereus]
MIVQEQEEVSKWDGSMKDWVSFEISVADGSDNEVTRRER